MSNIKFYWTTNIFCQSFSPSANTSNKDCCPFSANQLPPKALVFLRIANAPLSSTLPRCNSLRLKYCRHFLRDGAILRSAAVHRHGFRIALSHELEIVEQCTTSPETVDKSPYAKCWLIANVLPQQMVVSWLTVY